MTNKLSKAVLYSSISLLGFGLAGAASAYQFEVGAGYAQGDIENVDVDTVGVGGTFYFGEVDTGNGPLAEAAFLDRASSLSASYAALDVDGFAVDLDTTDVSLRFVSMNRWLGTLGYTSTDLDNDEDTERYNLDQFSIGVGSYFGENNTIVLQYTDIELEEEFSYWDVDGDSISLGFTGVAVGPVTHKFEASVTATEIEDEDATGFMLGWTVYPSMNVGAGVSFAKDLIGSSTLDGLATGSELDSQVLGFHASWFPTEMIELGLFYSDIEVEDVDADEIGLTASLRF